MKIKLKINLIIGISCGLTPLFCTSCSNGSSIVFSNFESYMSEDIMNSMHKKYNVSFQYYSTNEDIQNKFKKYYDVSVPSLYETIVLLQYDELSQID
ncbi:hypothetical protein FACS189459_4040 [Bacilli bacterium]|nr:hypothetical protein FACS189459_4040 [Bacilli bacterium]